MSRNSSVFAVTTAIGLAMDPLSVVAQSPADAPAAPPGVLLYVEGERLSKPGEFPMIGLPLK